MIKDMYNKFITGMRTSRNIKSEFHIIIELHQEPTLSLFRFALVMSEFT